LRQRGVAFPCSLGPNSHNALPNLVRRLAGDQQARDAFLTELSTLHGGIRTVVLSSENLSMQLRGERRIGRLKALLAPHVDAYRVIMYLRRQDEQRVSQFSTAMRRGKVTRQDPFDVPPLDYAEILDDWAGVFGKDAIVPRIFARDALLDGDVVADFVQVAGIGPFVPLKDGVERNASLRPHAQLLLRMVAAEAMAQGISSDDYFALPGRGHLLRVLEERFSGTGLLPSRAEATTYLEQCRASNERVRAAWFPERTTLFPEDFSRYPEASVLPTDAEMLSAAVAAVVGLLTTSGSAFASIAMDARGSADAAGHRPRQRARQEGRNQQGKRRAKSAASPAGPGAPRAERRAKERPQKVGKASTP
jgi:hypothetical protein